MKNVNQIFKNNKHLMDDGNNGLSNRNSETINPININVSYNNNRPFTVNDFNNPENERNTQNGQESGKRTTDINSFRFDDGCRSGIDSINQKYFTAYLENPLNKNQPKVSDNNERNKNQPQNSNQPNIAKDPNHKAKQLAKVEAPIVEKKQILPQQNPKPKQPTPTANVKPNVSQQNLKPKQPIPNPNVKQQVPQKNAKPNSQQQNSKLKQYPTQTNIKSDVNKQPSKPNQPTPQKVVENKVEEKIEQIDNVVKDT
jgi:hypothetical protein